MANLTPPRQRLTLIAFLLLALAGLVCGAGALLAGPAPIPVAPARIVSLELAGNAGTARQIVLGWDRAQVLEKVRSAIRWDYGFVFAYGAGGILLARLFHRRPGARWLVGPSLLLPLAALLNCSENLALSRLLGAATGASVAIETVAGRASVKFILLAIGFGALGASGVAWLLRRPFITTAVATTVGWWARTQVTRRILSKCRWSLLGVLLGLSFFSNQGIDLFRTLDRPGLGMLWANLGALLWATNAWYWARTLVAMDIGGHGAARKRLAEGQEQAQAPLPWLAVWLPRLLGTSALALFSAAIRRAAVDAQDLTKSTLRTWSLTSTGLTVAFLLFVTFRRDVAALMQRRRNQAQPARMPTVEGVPDVASLSPGAKRFLSVLLGIGVAFLAFFWLWADLATSLGTIAVVVLAASVWIPLWSLLTYLSHRARFPVSVALCLLALGISGARCSDNREVRTVEGARPWERRSLDQDLRARIDRLPNANDGRAPLFLVAAEGGGIRAAYWTAAVLGSLQDGAPRFAQNLAGVSAVSGGSFGAAVFAALLAEDPRLLAERARALGCKAGKVGEAGEVGTYECLGRHIIATDMLAPNLASMLFPDLLQRFLPVPLPRTDRALAFEAAWEQAWAVSVGTDRFAGAFDSLWGGDPTTRPALFLNATHVETGKRLIVSSVRVDPATFVDAEDALSRIAASTGGRTLPLSTAAHMSARFPYISPAGKMPGPDRRKQGHVVDGGYFENSGATTALDVLASLDTIAKDSGSTAAKLTQRTQVIIILITNSVPGDQEDTTDRWANDLAEPPRALLSVRTGRGDYAAAAIGAALRQSRLTGCVRRIAIFKPNEQRTGISLPLGWVLSKSSQEVMDRQRLVRNDVIGELSARLGDGATCPDETSGM